MHAVQHKDVIDEKYTYTYIHIHKFANLHTHTGTDMCICMQYDTQIRDRRDIGATYIYTHTYIYTCTDICMHAAQHADT